MSVIDEYRKINTNDITLALAALLGVIGPGFLTIYLFKPELVENLETLKLILFSCSLTLPILIINVTVIDAYKNTEKLALAGGEILASLSVTSFVLYSALVISYLFSLSFKWHLGAIFGVQIILSLMLKVSASKPLTSS